MFDDKTRRHRRRRHRTHNNVGGLSSSTMEREISTGDRQTDSLSIVRRQTDRARRAAVKSID